MKYLRPILIAVLIAFNLSLFFSCGKGKMCNCLESTGDITTETRAVNGFNKIYIQDNINLIITEDTVFALSVEAGSNMLSLIKSDVTDSCLYLKNDNKCNWLRSFKKDKVNVYLKCRKLNSIVYKDASGNITSTDTLHFDKFQLDGWGGSGTIDLTISAQNTLFILHTGPEDLNIKGLSANNYIYASGNGKADMRNLITGYTAADNLSTNDFYVNVKNQLDITITSLGSIYYTGNPPTVHSDITGSGQLIPF